MTRLFPDNSFSKRYLDPIADEHRSQEVDWVSGCAMMFRKDTFDSLGGFDSRFFLFHEDVDFCYRLKEAGYKVVYNPEILVEHELGISENVPTIKINYERHRGMWVYYARHLRRNRFVDAIVACGIVLRFMTTSVRILFAPVPRVGRKCLHCLTQRFL